MNNNGNQPAFATPEVDTPDYRHSGQIGLTKREYFAAKFLQSLIVHDHSPDQNGTDAVTITDLCADAIRYTDALLEALEKTSTPNI